MTLGNQGAVALEGNRYFHRSAFPVRIIDRIGAGDAFAAGVLDGYLHGSLEEGLRRGVALAALAMTQIGDSLVTRREELDSTLDQTQTQRGILR